MKDPLLYFTVKLSEEEKEILNWEFTDLKNIDFNKEADVSPVDFYPILRHKDSTPINPDFLKTYEKYRLEMPGLINKLENGYEKAKELHLQAKNEKWNNPSYSNWKNQYSQNILLQRKIAERKSLMNIVEARKANDAIGFKH